MNPESLITWLPIICVVAFFAVVGAFLIGMRVGWANRGKAFVEAYRKSMRKHIQPRTDL